MNPKAILGYLIGLALLTGGLVWLGARGTVATTSVDDPDRPVATAASDTFDFGAMTNKDIRQTTFTVTNDGRSDLVLSQVSTSCDCTYAYVTVGGEKSPKFTMHGRSSWSAAVAPGESATVEVVYEPAIMPVTGPVTRQVSVATNDPARPNLDFTVTANVTE